MTKSLTELWKDGTIKRGFYYLKTKHVYDNEDIDYLWEDHFRAGIAKNPLEEVLAPVPSYDHFSQLVKKVEQLQKQLNEANDIIKEYVETTPKVPNDGCHIPNYNLDNAERYIKKWGVK